MLPPSIVISHHTTGVIGLSLKPYTINSKPVAEEMSRQYREMQDLALGGQDGGMNGFGSLVVQGLGFRGWGLGFGIRVLVVWWLKDSDADVEAFGLGCRGSGCRIQGFGLWD